MAKPLPILLSQPEEGGHHVMIMALAGSWVLEDGIKLYCTVYSTVVQYTVQYSSTVHSTVQ
jgi:hypothetical protein